MMRRLAVLLVLACVGAAPLPAQVADTTLPVPLTLDGVMRIGRQHAVASALSRLSAEAAGARVGERRADLLPSINGSATWSRQRMNLDEFGIAEFTGVTDPFSIWRLTVSGSQTIFDASALTRLGAARDSADAAGLDARAAGDLAATTAGIAYLRYAAALETVQARQADSAIAASLYQQARDLLAAGVSAAIDETRSQVALFAVQTDLELARNQRDQARLVLTRALSLPPTVAVVMPDSIARLPLAVPSDPDSAVAFAFGHRAEIAAEAARAHAVSRSLTAVRREQLPSMGVQGALQRTGPGTDRLSSIWHVDVGVQIPLLDGFRRQRRIEEASLRLDAERLRQNDLQGRVATEVRSALLNLSSAREQVRLAETRLGLAEQELDQARQRFAAGVAGTVETTNAQSSVVAARDGLIQAHAALGSAEVSVMHAVGLLNDAQ